MTYITDGIDR